MAQTAAGALSGITVLDVSRMLPGAVLARMLLDLGARLIKVEQPALGDPMRSLAPLVGGTGAGFCAFFRGAESITVDLGQPNGAAVLRKLARHADVVVESFRQGKLEAWGIGPDSLMRANPSLVVCSLAGYAPRGPASARVGHDINFVAETGLLSRISPGNVPGAQFADVSGALLACTTVLAALLQRQRSGRGVHVRQPLCGGPLPFLTQEMADESADPGSGPQQILSGDCPAYRLYRCGDGLEIAVGALEPKFWVEFTQMLELPEVAGDGLDSGKAGEQAARQVERVLQTQPRGHWIELSRKRNLPVTAVLDVPDAAADLQRENPGLLEETPAPGGATLSTPGCYSPLGSTPLRPAPRLGQHTRKILIEFGIDNPG